MAASIQPPTSQAFDQREQLYIDGWQRYIEINAVYFREQAPWGLPDLYH